MTAASMAMDVKRGTRVGEALMRLGATDSTNERLREMVEQGAAEGTVVVAESQSQGRGRHGRSWASPRGGLYLSVLLKPKPEEASLLTLLSGIAPARALTPLGLKAHLKWPNDLMLGRAKLGGILGEAILRRKELHLILGFGLNANVPRAKLPEGATSLLQILGRKVDVEELMQGILAQLETLFSTFKAGGAEELLREYRILCTTLGRKVEVRTASGNIRGAAVDLTPHGLLVVEDDRGRRHEVADATVRHVA